MRVLLISPSQKHIYGKRNSAIYPSLGLLYIGAGLESNGHEVRLIDIDAGNITTRQLTETVIDYRPQMVGITATTPMFYQAVQIASLIKKIDDIPVVLGGPHATVAPTEAISVDGIDFVVQGEGEYTLSELTQQLEQGTNNFHTIKGLWYKSAQRIINTPSREFISDLDSLPFPARHLLPNLNAYEPPDSYTRPFITLISTRGCIGRCTFCCTPKIHGTAIRMRSVSNIIAEISDAIEKFGIKEVHFADDCFTIEKTRVLEFCELVKQRNWKLNFFFMNGLRADCVDTEILKALKEIGLKNVGYGVESGNQSILDRSQKNITLHRIKETFQLSRSLKLDSWAFFILGLPGETSTTIRQTINFAKEIDPDFVKFFVLKPYPGTQLYEQLISEGRIHNFDYSTWGLYSPAVHSLDTMDSEDIDRWVRIATREFYIRPRKIIAHLRRIRTLTQLKLNFCAFLFLLRKLIFKT